jgi:glycosyltransferase involved in cell wall biosynthesis
MTGLRHRIVARQVQKVFAVSAEVSRVLARAGVPDEKIKVIYLGTSPSVYKSDLAVREQMRRELGVGPHQTLVVSTSHLRPGKGVDLLPDAAAALSQDPGDVVVLAAGDGPLRPGLEQRAKELRLPADAFRLVGVREDVPGLLAAADLFLFPTTSFEGFPLGVLEAMAAGVPVLATAVTDLRELTEGTISLAAPGDLGALVAKARELLADPQRALSLAGAARRLVSEHFTVEAAARNYADSYFDTT